MVVPSFSSNPAVLKKNFRRTSQYGSQSGTQSVTHFRRTSQYGRIEICKDMGHQIYISEELVSMVAAIIGSSAVDMMVFQKNQLVWQVYGNYPSSYNPIRNFRRTSQYGSRLFVIESSPTLSLISEELVSMVDRLLSGICHGAMAISEELVSMVGLQHAWPSSPPGLYFRRTSQYGSRNLIYPPRKLRRNFRRTSQYGSRASLQGCSCSR